MSSDWFLFTAVILLAIFEAGYIYRILEETIKGSKKLPKFNNLRLMFCHGLKELIVLILYFLIPILLFGLFYLNFLTSLDINDVPIVTDIFFLIVLSITIVIYIFFPAVSYTGQIIMETSDRALISERYTSKYEQLVLKD